MMKSTTYTPEFRAEPGKLVLAQGLTLEEVTKRIAISKETLANWVSAAKLGSAPGMHQTELARRDQRVLGGSGARPWV